MIRPQHAEKLDCGSFIADKHLGNQVWYRIFETVQVSPFRK